MVIRGFLRPACCLARPLLFAPAKPHNCRLMRLRQVTGVSRTSASGCRASGCNCKRAGAGNCACKSRKNTKITAPVYFDVEAVGER